MGRASEKGREGRREGIREESEGALGEGNWR